MNDTHRQLRPASFFLDGWHPYAWVVLIIFLVYFRALFFDFTYLDDKDLIIDNYGFISDLSNIPQAFMSRVFPRILVPYYRPLLTVSFMLDSAIGGNGSTLVFHITNLIIHSVVCCLALRLFLKLGFDRLAGLLFTVFFAVHPALVQAVAWIPGRNDSLLAAFSLAAFLSMLSYMDGRKAAGYAMHMIFFALALFTKETAVALVPVCLLYLKLVSDEGMSRRGLKAFLAGWLLTAGAWFFIRQLALRGSFDSTAGGLTEALMVSLPAIAQYIGKIVMPFNLSVFPTIRDTTFLYGVVTLAVICIALRRSKEKRSRFVLFGLAWFLLFMAPSLVRISAGLVHDFQEHRMYLPMVGAIVVLHEIDIFKHLAARRRALAGCILALSVLTAINVYHAGNFRNKLAYWKNAVDTAPHSWLTHMKVGYMYFEEKMYGEAEREYRKAISMNRIAPAAYAGLGHVYLAQNRIKDAEFEFRRAIASCDANYPSYVSLGTVYYRQGRLQEAARMWVEALKLQPDYVDALRNMAIFCVEQKDYRSALFYVNRLQEIGVEPPKAFMETLRGLKGK